MPYEAFHARCPEIADKETRVVTVLQSTSLGVPAGDYCFIELYCNDVGCDCRRVFFDVRSPTSTEDLAVVAYGWESPSFYARWLGSADPRDIEALKGPVLNLASPQSPLAPAILEIVRNLLLRDEAYVERLKRHYQMFKAHVEGRAHGRKSRARKRRARRA